MRKYIDIITSALPLSEDIDVGPHDSAQERKERYSGRDGKGANDAKVGDKVKGRRGTYEVLSRDGLSAELKRVSDGKVHTAPSLSFYEKVISEAFDDFKDPALDKETDDSKQPENDFQMFKDKAEVGAPETAKNDETESNDDAQDCEGDDCEEIGKSLNAKDMKAFVGGYKKLCAGAVESISTDEAKELAEIMLALFKSKIEDNPIEESNQDNKLERDAEASGKAAPENPNAPKKPLSPAEKREAAANTNDPKAAPSGPKPAPSEAKKAPATSDADEDAEEAKEFVKKKLG